MSLKTSALALAVLSLSLPALADQHHSFSSEAFHAEVLGGERDAIATIMLKQPHLELAHLNELGMDIAGVNRADSEVDVVVNDWDLERLAQAGFSVRFDKAQKLYDKGLDSEYKEPAEVEQMLREIADANPEIAKLESIGKSSEGRDIWALKISDNVTEDEANESSVLFNGMHHAREVMTPEVVLDAAAWLVSNYVAGNEKAVSWVNNNEIYLVPMVNVDGNAKVWAGSRMWRKNTNYGHGVDINRNYPYQWGACNGSSGSTWSDTYRGPTAGSEPEAQALMGLVSRVKPVFDISFHSYSEIVIYPMGCKGARTGGNRSVVEGIGAELGRLVDYEPGTAWELLYSVDGGDIDWMYGVEQVLPYVLEVNSSRQGFQPSYSQWRDVTVDRVRPSWQYLLDRMAASGLKGRLEVENASEYRVKVERLENGVMAEVIDYKVNPNGSFHIVLDKGDYKVSVRQNGRTASDIQNITVGETLLTFEPKL
tara:strand:+ start:3065 stop:4510 length:1446 start_codon:yes stop_codon:yes gene_type:complete